MTNNKANRARLMALVEIFDLSLSDIAKVAGVSRPLVSQVLHGKLDGAGLWGKLERCLPEIIAKRGRHYFAVEAVTVEKVQEIVERLKIVA